MFKKMLSPISTFFIDAFRDFGPRSAPATLRRNPRAPRPRGAKGSVARDKRRAKKARAVARAKHLGHA